jgi:hypothetical protein
MVEFVMILGKDLLGEPSFLYHEGERIWHMGLYYPHNAHVGGEVKIFRDQNLIHSSAIIDVPYGTALRHSFGICASANGYTNIKFSDLQDGDILKLSLPDVDGDPLILDKWIANRRDLYIKAYQDMTSKLGRKPTREEFEPTASAIDQSVLPVPVLPFPN